MLGYLSWKRFGSSQTFPRINTLTFWKSVILHTYLRTKMEQTECSETSAYKIQTPGNNPEESIQHSEHGESSKSRIQYLTHPPRSNHFFFNFSKSWTFWKWSSLKYRLSMIFFSPHRYKLHTLVRRQEWNCPSVLEEKRAAIICCSHIFWVGLFFRKCLL